MVLPINEEFNINGNSLKLRTSKLNYSN